MYNKIQTQLKRILVVISFSIYFFCTLFLSLNAEEENIDLPPKSTTLSKIHLPAYKTFSLKNGLKVYVIENHKLPTISYFLYLDYFPNLENNKAGLGEFTTRLMKQGAGNRNKSHIDEELDFMGVDFNIDENLIFASSLLKYSSQSLSIISDVVKNPKFEESEFVKLKDEMLSEIQSDKQDPNAQLNNVAKTLLYPATHPYSEVPTEKSIKRITMKDCKNYHSRYFKPNIAHLAISGDIHFEDAKVLAETHFGNWQSGEVPKFKAPKLFKSRQTKIYLKNRNDSVQSVIKVSHNIDLKPGQKEIYSAVVMNTLLGGGTFRLNQNLREKHGLTYGVYSSLRPDKWIGNFSIDLSTESSLTGKSIEQILYEMNRIRREKVKNEELQLVKNYLTGQFSLSLENPSTIALFGIKTALYNLPSDYYEKYLEGIQSVTEEDVLQAANRYITPDQTHIIIVGKKKDLKKSLKSLKKIKTLEVK